MTIKIGFVMDPIESITPHKDTSFAMMLEAQRRGWDIYYFKQTDIYLQQQQPYTQARQLSVTDSKNNYYKILAEAPMRLNELDVIIMRKDPPFNMNYIYTTYLLELAEKKGTLVLNRPQSLRDANEKLFTSWFPQCCPETVVSSQLEVLTPFIEQVQDVIVKPLDGMGGDNIFRVKPNDDNLESIISELTAQYTTPIIAQRFIPDIKNGDKRILLINGEPIGVALARVPHKDDFRGNLAKGATGEGRELTERDLWICQQVGPTLREKGLLFVGLDVIGDYLTEINVTSPTCVRELDALFSLNIAGTFFDVIQQKLAAC